MWIKQDLCISLKINSLNLDNEYVKETYKPNKYYDFFIIQHSFNNQIKLLDLNNNRIWVPYEKLNNCDCKLYKPDRIFKIKCDNDTENIELHIFPDCVYILQDSKCIRMKKFKNLLNSIYFMLTFGKKMGISGFVPTDYSRNFYMYKNKLEIDCKNFTKSQFTKLHKYIKINY